MQLSNLELVKQIHQYRQDEYEQRLLATCASRIRELDARLKELEGVLPLFEEYLECMADGYPSQCGIIMDKIREVFKDGEIKENN